MTALLLAQVVYATVGVAYNVVSLRAVRAGRQPLSQGSAAAGLAVMLAYGASLSLGFAGLDVAYRAAMTLFIVVIGYAGLLVHLRRGPSEYYRTSYLVPSSVSTGQRVEVV
ncbi:hypothetical protein [Streptomyces torulosus]|uniref:hypothetical protein n=1 Tax=Streptomyces torulosus TaxID=68276 RepID=UPI0006EB789C|nr:hypothetical protein [Streptomyces torulosus]